MYSIRNKREKRKTIHIRQINSSVFIIMGIVSSLLFMNSCNKNSETNSINEPGSLTDIDGNVYNTVKIGNQWWMAENLKVKRYRNGDSINYVTDLHKKSDSTTWVDAQTGTYYRKSGGLLYNGYTIDDVRKIAPAGWHIPTDEEWKTLEIYLGMDKSEADKVNWRGTNQGDELKIQYSSVEKRSWTIPTDEYKVWGTNESGFSALGDGCIMFNGIGGTPGDNGANYTGFWWTATQQDTGAYYRYLDYNKPNVFRFYGPKTYGFSIRCVKDAAND